MSFFLALYTLQYVLIVKKNILCNLYTYSKKKNDSYFSMGKNTKVMPQNAPLSICFLGKGRESLCLKPYEKAIIASALSDLLPSMC